MKRNSKKHRRSIRLPGYDYSQAGAYFITLCTQNSVCVFGDIVDAKIVLNDAGRMVLSVWNDIPVHYPGIGIDAFQIMPNHIHGIITIDTTHVGADPCVCPDPSVHHPNGHTHHDLQQQEVGQPRGVAPTGLTLGDVVQRFKTLTINCYIDGVHHHHWIRFDTRLWQRNYYEHIMRDENEFHRIRQYIQNNPAKWGLDPNHPGFSKPAESPETAEINDNDPWMVWMHQEAHNP